MSRLPVIGIPADRRLCGNHYFHMVGEKYLDAVALGASALPVLIPRSDPSSIYLHYSRFATGFC